MRRAATLMAACLLGLTVAAGATTYLVKPDGSGDFPTVQAALAGVSDGDIIELANGRFTGPGNRNIDFLGRRVVVRSQAGDPDSCVIDCQYLGRGFWFHTGEDSSAVLQGLTVTNGYVISDGYGAAVRILGADPWFVNCVFRENVAGIDGGAVYANSGGARLQQCTIEHNTAGGKGGALCVVAGSATIGQSGIDHNTAGSDGGGLRFEGLELSIVGCTFRDNLSHASGGALYIESAEHVHLDATAFIDNAADGEGGAMSCSYTVASTVNRCDFLSNDSGSNGGGISAHLPDAAHSMSLETCTLVGNGSLGLGGGISAYWGNGTIEMIECDVRDNHAVSGGGARLSCGTTMSRCSFMANSADDRGGALLVDNSLDVSGCLFCANSGLNIGGAVHMNSSGPIVFANCTLYANEASAGSGFSCGGGGPFILSTIIALGLGGGGGFYCQGPDPTPTLVCCDIYGNAGGDWTSCIAFQYGVGGNISADPLFCDAAGGNFWLMEDSPCAPFTPPNPVCDLIGAMPVGCELMAVSEPHAPVLMEPILLRAAPNPFTTFTVLDFTLPSPGKVRLTVLDSGGRLVRGLVDGKLLAGTHRFPWDGLDDGGRTLASGAYYYRLEVNGDAVGTETAVILR